MAISALVASVAVSAVGVGVSMYGSQQAASANRAIAGQQQQANQISLQAMEVDSRRRQLETIRQAQVGRANSTAAATSQNAQLGSGLQGGLAQNTSTSNFNVLGLNQNLDLGKEMASVNNQISQDRISLSNAQGIEGFGSGLTSLGNIGVSTFGAYNRMAQGIRPTGSPLSLDYRNYG